MSDFHKLTNKYRHLSKRFNDLYRDTEKSIQIENRILGDCLKDQINLQLQWSRLFSRVRNLMVDVDDAVQNQSASSFQKAMSDPYKDISVSEAKQYANINMNYIMLKKLYNKVKRLYNDTESVVDTIETRKYTLKTITDAKIKEVESEIV